MSEDYFVRKAEAARKFGVRIRTLERWEQIGYFPRRVQIGPGAVGYRASELEKFAESRKYAERNTVPEVSIDALRAAVQVTQP
jgi:predicted DNA-binding transcriptional regulator AlpA